METVLDAIGMISISQWVMAVIGGLIFGMAAMSTRPLREHHFDVVRHYSRYMLAAMLMFYITFPFAQGLLGYLEDGSAVRLITVSATYAAFFIATAVSLLYVQIAKDGKG